jgi:hypothetical protein
VFRRLAAFLILALLLPATPSRAERACGDILLGDSLAVGMGTAAREMGFEVIAREGAGIGWLREQTPRCARRLVLVFGTNDLRGMTPEAADAYVEQIARVMERWPAWQAIWATPGCFARDGALEEGSQLLDRAISGAIRRGNAAVRYLPAVHRGRSHRCRYESADGVHTNANGYRSWWEGLTPVLARADQRPFANAARTESSRAGTPSASIAPFQTSAASIRAVVPGTIGRP